MLLAVYSMALGAALTLSAPLWARGLRRGGKYREGLGERLGLIPPSKWGGMRHAHGIWIHAVSVGEVIAVAPLVAALREALPGRTIVVSTTTRTGQAVARARFGESSVFYFPADFAFAVRAWLGVLRPSLIVLAESELWPRFLFEARRSAVPVAVINARLSPRSWPRYRRLRVLWRPLLRTLALVQAQTTEDAERFRALGAEHVSAGGNLKYDLPSAPRSSLLDQLAPLLAVGVPILVCGSTLAGEEALLLDVLPQEAITLLAPRHPERFAEVAALLAQSGRLWVRLSRWRLDPTLIPAGTTLLLDSVGELAALYALATVAIVGGGFLHRGGHNPLEPAALAKPVVIGPGFENFRAIVEALLEADALIVAEPRSLRHSVEALLADPQQASARGERAARVCQASRGATLRARDALLLLLEQSEAGR